MVRVFDARKVGPPAPNGGRRLPALRSLYLVLLAEDRLDLVEGPVAANEITQAGRLLHGRAT